MEQMNVKVKSITSRYLREEDGATMVEYVLLVILIGIFAIGAMKFLGSTSGNKLNGFSSNITNGA
jgi:Flp pilus assembly pilin Flp